MAAITGAVVGAVGAVGSIVGSSIQADKARRAQDQANDRLEAAKANRQKTINPYDNLTVDTKTAEFENQAADQSLANTLDTMKQSGLGAGSATALAQAALSSKQNIGANIRAQETENKKLYAQGRQIQFNQNEARTNMDLNRYASQSDQYAQQAASANQAMWSGVGSLVGSIGQGVSAA
jgi:hypothetical protein